MAILFRYVGQLDFPVSREKLLELRALTSAPQSIVTMDDISYKRIRESVKEWLI